MSFGWEGEKVRLVPLDRERHFENAVRWLNDSDVTRWMHMGDFPLTRMAEEEYFARIMKQNPLEQNVSDVSFAIETREDEHIGFTGLHEIQFRHGTASTGTVIGRAQLWGRGYGSDAIRVRTRYAFVTLGLRLLLTHVMAENARSHKALLKCGYREVGRIPARVWKGGAYRDVIQLALYRDDWSD